MKNKKLKFKAAFLVCFLAGMFTVVLAEPGGSDDPLITKSYIDNHVMPALREYIEERLSGASSATTAESAVFEVVEADAGQEIICSKGAELILRMGSATVIATEKGGLADTTAGYDLGSGTPMPSNHLLIVPVDDGRGFKAETDVIVLIKGGYTVK